MAKEDKKDQQPKEGSTAHLQVPAPVDAGGGGNADGSMSMGMLGGAGEKGEGDPDQKSTHVPPKTVESNLPDGSPKFADPGSVTASSRRKPKPSGTVEVEAVNRFVATVDGELKTVEPGDIVEIDAKEAASLGDNVKPA